ncbi:Membrane spanning protein (modular protein) [Streptomyces ambofaciens ATCC 23877]|uniref:Membrane spanning protein (Modular protein) n=1 Tax=Streptomyces ambofaciens (strain ATCC 23877 / 3486 / DSM 40053 / JCM 4204 / NBRC 12836 / NRRL B-2516) TaxID=278992 RepID=A0A0K2AVK0_STRA7|nr:Membrane spanning protein (modular protein) [Streptomyces ambofaciens ATCC 23877]
MTAPGPRWDRAPVAGLRLGSGRASGPRPGKRPRPGRDPGPRPRPGAGGEVAGTDQGSATVWSVGAIAVLCLVFGIVLALGQAVVARHRAAGGADMAALAAADHWALGGTAACVRAERVARAQGTRLVRCVLTGQVSDVTASSGRGLFAAEVRARAGPASEAAAPVPRAPSTEEPPTGSPVVGSPTTVSPDPGDGPGDEGGGGGGDGGPGPGGPADPAGFTVRRPSSPPPAAAP